MRLLVALFLVLPALAGCTQPDGDDFDPSCPTWNPSRNTSEGVFLWKQNETVEPDNVDKDLLVGKGMETNRSRPLDKFDIHVKAVGVADARLVLRAYAGEGGRQLDILDAGGRDARSDLVVDESAQDVHLMVRLTRPGQAPSPSPLHLVWTFEADLDDDPRTDSEAAVDHEVTPWYLHEKCV